MPFAIIPPAAPSPGTILYEWIDPAGVPHSLPNDGDVIVEVGSKGLGLPAAKLSMDKLPFESGSIVRYAEIDSRQIELHFFVRKDSGVDLDGLLDTLQGWFHTADETKRTPGYLRITRRDGTQRQIACYYTGGLEGDTSIGTGGELWQRVTVDLTAASVWATAVAPLTTIYTLATFSDFAVLNTGHLEAPPIWTVTGPLTSMTFRNLTSGRFWTMNLAMLSTDSVTVDTRPSSERTTVAVADSDGINQYSRLTAASDLWRLVPGSNEVQIAMTGASGATEIELSYLPRYRSLLR